MAEIKSAIELAMERTKNLVMDEKEKERSLIQEGENRLKGFVRRFLEGSVDVDDFRAQYDKLDLPEDSKRALVVDIVVSGFDVGEDTKLFDLLHVVDRSLDEGLRKELDSLEKQFSKALEKKSGEVRKRILNRLKEMGISGTALEPNLTAWDEWKEAAAETKKAFNQPLQRWKDQVKALTV
jgi:hypothetical protein